MASQLAEFERATGVPFFRRIGFTVTLQIIIYALFAGLLCVFLLPVGFMLTGTTLLLAQLAVFVGITLLILTTTVRIRAAAAKRAQLWATVNAMGWRFVSEIDAVAWGGSIDEQIHEEQLSAIDYIDAGSSEVPFDSVRFDYAFGEEQGATVHSTRAVRIPLTAEFPRISLRAKGVYGTLNELPRVPRAHNTLRLEGNFSDVFDVSVPTGYERDALYLLTPDLMIILLDHAEGLDLEIVNSTLHVYFPALDLTDEEARADFVAVIAVLHERFNRRARNYTDDRAPALDPEAYRYEGDRLSEQARSVSTRARRARFGPVVLTLLAPLVPLAIGIAWTWLGGGIQFHP